MIASAIITAAFREGNFIPIGQTPTTDQQTEALARLNAYVAALMGDALGLRMKDWPVPSGQRATTDFHTTIHAPYPASVEGGGQPSPGVPQDTSQWAQPPSNSRLLVKITSDTTIYFPEAPQPGARMRAINMGGSAILTISGNGRLIEDAASVTLAADFTRVEWFYREDLGGWVQLADMELDDESALPPEFDEFLISALTIRLSPTYGLKPLTGTLESFKRGLSKLTAHYQQSAFGVGNAADVPRAAQTYGDGGWF